MALPFSIWREEIEAELAQAQQEITAATVAIHAAELSYNAVKAQHEAMRNAILPLRQPLASALAARVRHSEESVHAAGRDMVCARGAVTGLRDRRADIEEALRQIEQLLATPSAVDDDLKYGARATTPRVVKFVGVGERQHTTLSSVRR
jgi:chromosome segregation ATPase